MLRSKEDFISEFEEKIEKRISTNLASEEKYLDFEFIKIESATLPEQQDLISQKTSVQERYFSRICKSLNNWTPLPSCPQGCNLFVKENLQKRNYDQYWHNSSENSRFNFIYDMTDMTENPRLKFKYYLSVDEGCQEVCRVCFCKTIAESNNFITKVLEYKAKNANSKYGVIHKKYLTFRKIVFFFRKRFLGVSSNALRKSLSLKRSKPLLQEKKATPDTLDSSCKFSLKIWKPPSRKGDANNLKF